MEPPAAIPCKTDNKTNKLMRIVQSNSGIVVSGTANNFNQLNSNKCVKRLVYFKSIGDGLAERGLKKSVHPFLKRSVAFGKSNRETNNFFWERGKQKLEIMILAYFTHFESRLCGKSA